MPLRSILNGIRILDLTTNLPGPLATQILGDFGADVIKIESLEGDPVRYYPPFIDQESYLNLTLNRNKRSFALNLKSEEALKIFYRLVEKCDVVIVGFRASTVKKLKIDYTSLSKINSKLIYCHLTGYEASDDRVGHDLNYIGEAGILHLTGPKEKPVVPGVPIADIGAGSLAAVITILGALFQRHKTGSQYFNVAMVEHLIPWLSVLATTFLADLDPPERELHPLSGYIPWYRIYEAKKGELLTFAPIEDKFWRNFCIAVEREDLLDKQHNLELCEKELTLIFRSRDLNEWLDIFKRFDIPGGPIFSLKEVFKKKSRLTEIYHSTLGSIKVLSSPYLDPYNPPKYRPAPMLGEHTKELLEELGLEDRIERLLKNNNIRISTPRE